MVDSKDLILLYKIPIGRRKYIFEIYREFGHVTSKRVARPVLLASFQYNCRPTQGTDYYCL